MRVPRLYIHQTLAEHSSLIVDGKQAHYMINVLRMDSGRALIIFNGDGCDYHATISAASKKQLTIEIESQQSVASESPLFTSLAIGISKGDRMDWVIQKATELGVTEIQPLFTERGEVKLKGERLQKKLEHWKQVSISACEQCQRAVLPTLLEPKPYGDYLALEAKRSPDTLKLVCHFNGQIKLSELSPPKQVTFLIGPEGGLSDKEIELSTNFGFQTLTLGPRILRTETAPVAMLSLAQHLWGDF